MRTIAIEEFGGPDLLRPLDLPRPRPDRGEIVIRVVAAGVSPLDGQIREGRRRHLHPHAFPLVPGWDAAGVVDALGPGTCRFRKGDRVWACARKHVVQWGCYAEYVAVPESAAAAMPAKLLFEEAAAIPLCGLAAFQCLFGEPAIGPGSSVLIQAAAGGVGHLAVQLAANAGAVVVGTAGAANHEFVEGLGAAHVIDYDCEDFVEATRRFCPDGVDLVLDTLGGGYIGRALPLVKPGGRLVSLAGGPDAEAAAARGVDARAVEVVPDAEQLARLAELVDLNRLRPYVQKIFPLAQAAEAQRRVQTGHTRGKLVLNL